MVGKRKRTIQNYKTFSKNGRDKETKYTSNSTQTSPLIFKEQELLVLIKRLPKELVYRRMKNEKQGTHRQKQQQTELTIRNVNCMGGCERQSQNEEDDSSENDIESLVTMLKRPEVLSRLPSNYDHFVKPITNNERANSTLDNISINKDQDTVAITPAAPRRRDPIPRTITKNYNYVNIRPGPKCTKPKDYLELMECHRIPIMLDGSDCHEEIASPNLSPIIERSGERTSTSIGEDEMLESFVERSISPELNNMAYIADVNPEVDLLKENNVSVPRIVDIASSSNNHCSSEANSSRNQQVNDANMTDIQGGAGSLPVSENVRHTNENFTTLMRSRRQENDENANSDNRTSDTSNGTRSNRDGKTRKRHKYIIIEADTVHIHNHFYNQ